MDDPRMMLSSNRRNKLSVSSSFLLFSVLVLDCRAGIPEDTYPPQRPIYDFFPRPQTERRQRLYPTGKEVNYFEKSYDDGYRVTMSPSCPEEAKERDFLRNDIHNSVRKAAEVHRRVRKYTQEELLKPGMKLIDICESLENATRTYLDCHKSPLAGLKAGIGFPTGVSLNNCAAHYTSLPGDNTVLKYDDVLKVDFGVHVNGYIVDSAFTWAPNPQFENLLAAVKDATYTGVQECGIDVRLCDVGEAIQEVMESYEVEINGKTYAVKCVENLMGHTIEPYKIHGGKSVPIVSGGPKTKMEENEIYAIETFGSTGQGYVWEHGKCSHFMLETGRQRRPVRMPKARELEEQIFKNFRTLPWCQRYLERTGVNRYALALNNLIEMGVVSEHPPLKDKRGSYVAQYEHTLILRPTCKEIVSQGADW